MLELPPEVETQLREKAARNGQGVADYLRQILGQPTELAEDKPSRKEYLEREGEDWTEEDLRVDAGMGKRQPGNGRKREAAP